MKRPMPVFLAFLILGIIWGSLSLTPLWFLSASLFVFTLGLIFMLFFKIRLFIILPFLFVLGFMLSYYKTNECNAFCDGLADSRVNITVRGEVADINKNSITVKADDFGKFGSSPKAVKIICYFDDAGLYSIGDTITAAGRLNALGPKYNPSDFDEIQYYKCRGISYKMYFPETEYISSGRNIPYYLNLLRTKAGTALDNMYTEENSGILKAMLLGDKDYLTDETELLYKNAGIYHILAISGLHISIIASVLMIIFKRPYQSIAIIMLLFSYAVFTGLSPSAVRAVIMMSVLLFGRLIHRRYDLISSLCFSAFLILIINPMYLKDCGFLYSYCSVLGIALFASHFSKGLKKLWGSQTKLQRAFADTVGVSAGAVSVTKLINMWFFYSVTVYDFISNLFVIPSVIVVLLSSAFSLFFYCLNIKIYTLFAFTAGFILNLYKTGAEGIGSLPFCIVTTGRPVLSLVLLYIIFIITLKLSILYKKKAVVAVSLLTLSSGVFIHKAELNRDRTAFLYVGQGDGIVGFAGGKTFVYDGGGTREEPSEADEGTYTILPYLEYMGKTRVDYAFISHIDNDHMKGVYELIGNIEIGEIFLPAGSYSSDLYTLLMEKAVLYNIPLTYFSAGDSLKVNESSSFSCLYPFSDQAEKITDVNDTSMVLKLSLKDTDFLFTGDITSAAEEEILKANTDISANVIKIPHHGSKYSSSKAFIAAVSPSLAVISCGKNNVYGFPNQETVDTLNCFDIPFLVTNTRGAVIVTPEKDKLKVETALSE